MVYICNFVKTIFDIKYIDINLVMPLVGILSWIWTRLYITAVQRSVGIYTLLSKTPPNGTQKLRVDKINPFSEGKCVQISNKAPIVNYES